MRRVGRYELGSEIASGGMATVYEAKAKGESGFSRRCAVKLLHPHLARDQAFGDLFLDEARIAASIHHPNVCQILDFGREADGTAYIAMELLEGTTYSKVIARTFDRHGEAWPPEVLGRLVAILAEAAEGLAAAHEARDEHGRPREIVHRDVSPSNVMVTFDGAVKVLDFGIARARDQVHETAPGEVKGKFAYMSPEQMRGEDVDARSDVWSLGVVLWELLAKARLFRRNTQAATVSAVQSEEITRPSIAGRSVPAELEELAMHALARSRNERVASAREFARRARLAARNLGATTERSELAAWLGELDARVDPARSEAPTVAAPARSRPWILGLLLTALGAGGLGIGWMLAGAMDGSSVTPVPSATAIDAGGADALASLDAGTVPIDASTDVGADAGSDAPEGPRDAGRRARDAGRTAPDAGRSPETTERPPPIEESERAGYTVQTGWAVAVDGGPELEGPDRRVRPLTPGPHHARYHRLDSPGDERTSTFEAISGRRYVLPADLE